ncbi:MAG TPA: hypothetical protein VFP78_18925 [Solirubrobacteraceae bacterium]|nr:hypothetical protein [Solirubrobacteraceae bacterium]
MSDARLALFGRLIDHAALFPPASLDMPEALEADRRARATPEAWMLDRFIVPASRLGELPAQTPPLSVVLDRGEGDLDAIAQYDVRLLEGRIDPEWIPETQALVDARLGVPAFWELAPGRALAGEVAAVREAGAGAKIRCGGVTADAFPPVEAVAAFVLACRDAGVRFKATAGLHHPIRHVDPATGFHMHGFLNLLAAAVFAHMGEDDLVPLLAEEDAAAFAVDAGGLEVHGRRADAAAIEAARAELFVAYGSCSFSEPVEDLTALGILPL